MRTFKRIPGGTEVRTFEEWKDLFESFLESTMNPIAREFSKNHSKHLDLLNRIIDLRNDFRGQIDNYYLEAYENLLVEVNGKYLRHSPLYLRKGGKVPINLEVAKLLLQGIDISKKETGSFLEFNDYYNDGLIDCFSLEKRAVFFGDDINSLPEGYFNLENLFPYDFPPVNKDNGIEVRIENMKRSLQSGLERDSRTIEEMVNKHQRNDKKIDYINRISSDPYFQSLSNRGLLKLKY